MSGNRVSLGFLTSAHLHDAIRRDEVPRPSLVARVRARLRTGELDRMLAVGVPAEPGSALAVHAARLTSVEERETLARVLHRAVHDAGGGRPPLSSRMPLNTPNIRAAGDRIDQVTLRLRSPRPVAARGVARLRLLLADGTGPMYRYGRGDLEGRLGAALAAL